METCPHCQTRVLPMDGGVCPACRGDLSAPPSETAASPASVNEKKAIKKSRRRQLRTACLLIGTVAVLVSMGLQGLTVAYNWIALAILLSLLMV